MSSRYSLLALFSCLPCLLALPSTPLEQRNGGQMYTLPVSIPSIRHDDLYYTVDLGFDGQTLPVLLDTGSGDLLIASDQCNVVNEQSGCYLTKTFKIQKSTRTVMSEFFQTIVGLGSIYGFQSYLTVSGSGKKLLSDFAVPLANYSVTGNFQEGAFSGIFGLGPRNVSRNWYFHQHLPLVDELVSEGALAKPLFSVTLPRLGDPTSAKGSLTIGGIEQRVPASQITYNDMIDTLNYNYDPPVEAPQGWTAELQGIRVNGVTVKLDKGEIDGDRGRYISLMDSGSSRILLRRGEFERISDAFKGKTIVDPDQDIYFDCSVAQLIELKYHGKWFAIDPLDMIVPSDHGLVNGTDICHAPLGTWDKTFGDAIVGVPFLRNVLSVFDYVSNDLYSVQPRLGLASLTNANTAVKRYSSVYQQRLL